MFCKAVTRIVRYQHRQFSSGIKLLNEKAKAEEDYYFSKQDEKLMKQLIDQNSEVLTTEGLEVGGEAHSLQDKIRLVFMKNGIPPNVHPQLIDDLAKLVDSSITNKA